MKSDLDTLMQARGFDALVVMGKAKENHPLTYLANGAKVTHALVIRKQGEAPFMVVGPMERDEAAKSGLEVLTTTDFNLPQLLKETGNLVEAELRMIAAIFEQRRIGGTVSFYGVMDPGEAFIKLSRLNALLPDITITGEADQSIFDLAYATKDAGEITRIKSVAERTNQVMADVIRFIKGHAVEEGGLIQLGGVPLTVREVKAYLQERLMLHRLEDNGETIFALNRDAGVPHSRGEDGDQLRLGDCIIFDLFPREPGGGYFHDMTRTFCLGYAPEAVQQAYDQVMMAFNEVMKAITIGGKTADLYEISCDVLEDFGHPTARSRPGTTDGYVHGLGHGLGLQIHSLPRLGSISDEVVEVGQVFTVEPGVYYPEQGFGVRIEDTVYIDENGVQSLTTYPKDLIIKVGS